MQIEELLNEGLKREFKIVIPKSDLDAKLDAILTEFQTTATVKGFRPGKAPLSLLKRMHGDRALGQVLSETVQESSQKLFQEKNLRPAVQPEVDMDAFEPNSDLEYTLKVEVLPSVDISDFKAPALERWVADVSESDIDEAVEKIASGQKSFKKAAKTAKSKDGDAVLIDFTGRIDGEEFAGGKGEDHQLELGSSSFIPGFEEQLVGSKADDEKLVTVKFPEDYHSAEFAGKDAEFTVLVKEVRKPSETEINEDFAKGMGFDDLDALKAALKEQLVASNGQLTRAYMKRKLLDALAGVYDFEVPVSMVDMEFGQIWEQIKRDAISSGEAKPEDFEGQDAPSDIEEANEFRSIAERRVRLGLLLSEIGVANNVEVTQEEINRRMVDEARRFPGQETQVFEFFQKNEEARTQLRAPIFEEKVVDHILETADLTEKSVSREELEAAVQDMDAEEEVTSKAGKKKAAPKKEAVQKKPAAPKKAAPAKKESAEKKPAKKKKETETDGK